VVSTRPPRNACTMRSRTGCSSSSAVATGPTVLMLDNSRTDENSDRHGHRATASPRPVRPAHPRGEDRRPPPRPRRPALGGPPGRGRAGRRRRDPGAAGPRAGLPRLRKIGTWRSGSGKALVSVRRGQPAVRIRLEGQRWDELLLGTDDAPAVAGALAAVR
jgi:hypothetical protein